VDALLSDLAKACDDNARPASEDDHVGGVTPRFVASPASTAETAEVLRVAAQHDLYVVARGAGTKLGWGAAPRAVVFDYQQRVHVHTPSPLRHGTR